ncbi:unnamed protein product [Closterium sp. Naga37s-1]|nr:unnamed protein product [Closterium sp. Naga37s-1]
MSSSLAATFDFPASPSAFPSAFPSGFPSASPSASAWPHVSQIPPVDSILWPSDAARFDTTGGESFSAFHCGLPAEGGAASGTAAANVALGDWLKKAAASTAVETAPKVEGRKQRQSLLQQWFHDAPHGLIPPAFPEFNRTSQVNGVNAGFNAVNAVNAFIASSRVNTVNMDNTVHAVNVVNSVSVVTGGDYFESEPADASLRLRASESAPDLESEPAASVEPLKANACGHAIPAAQEREVQVGEAQVGAVQVGVEMGEVLRRPVEDIRREWLLLKKEIGTGQYGVIRRCVHRSTGEIAACKSIRKSAFQSAADVEAVRNEVAFMEELKGHANIIRIKQAVETNRHVHVVMELCEGGDLFDRIDSHGRLSEPSAAHILRSLMLALQHCHSHGIVHPATRSDQMASLKLYGMGYSPFVRRVLLTLHELGIEDYEWEQVNAPKGEARTPAFLAKQPFGKVPLLEDDGECIWESRAIMRYLADKYGAERGVNLLGKDALERGRVNQWIETEVNAFSPEAMAIAFERVFKRFLKIGEPDEEKVAAATNKLEKILDIYEKHLEGRAYLVGDSFTLADLTHLPVIELLQAAGVGDLIDSRPNLKAWLSRLFSRTVWKKMNEVAPLPTL